MIYERSLTMSQPQSWESITGFAASLVNTANELFSGGDEAEALLMFESAHHVLRTPSAEVLAVAAKQYQLSTDRLHNNESDRSKDGPICPADLYQEDECDVGPRLLRSPIRLDGIYPLHSEAAIVETAIVFNKALAQQIGNDENSAKQNYQLVLMSLRSFLSRLAPSLPPTLLLELGMRAHNNMGLLSYAKGDEDAATSLFQAALVFAKQLSEISKAYSLEYVTVLSNWCRVSWMRGDINDNLYKGLREVLRLRSANLCWDHPDVAAAHYNLAVAEYARQREEEATLHLRQYLHVASHRSETGQHDVDPIPALIHLLLLQNEEKDDSISQDLVRGLRTLQDKRQDQGPRSSDVASVLNFIGTLLFHKQDFENALLFFEEELRLEETMQECTDDISVAVTCNNIGRILQELGRHPEAVHFYKRALENRIRRLWYNLGLIHDRLGAYIDAISSFQMSLELRKTMLGRDHPDIACLLYNIGVLQMEQQQLSEASFSFREALRIRCVGTTGQLNDRHVIKTLEKLSSLQRAKGNINGALEASREVLRIQEVTAEYDHVTRLKDTGVTLRSIAELQHAIGNLDCALEASMESARKLEAANSARYSQDETMNSKSVSDSFVYTEHQVSSLLLVGSLHHELGEPMHALRVFEEALLLMEEADARRLVPSSHALREVTCMLARSHCAPVA
ncbi:predicted protein [Phaeodactylum tricornutum CCAP 1055/1]|uniref:Kinesin light chain n=1 Tax=Phaeodactylum tricornutum (strain CCAP 1055/1) TaxID=556484 RepID=B7FRC5_PHATC|nr:predicted protein [Phaeodactylum tricornutum CCAP 1055/1]EEC50986.1 predicted protein [Phaeodactylum tricornutum CCAP 1055/1]|eukprot:XP_002176523.1 predicted protein [Phaeodactylum tricornutum CCAP 1055/1]